MPCLADMLVRAAGFAFAQPRLGQLPCLLLSSNHPQVLVVAAAVAGIVAGIDVVVAVVARPPRHEPWQAHFGSLVVPYYTDAFEGVVFGCILSLQTSPFDHLDRQKTF